jgi:uncharacterized protein YcbX
VTRIGFTPLKGARHLEHPTVELSADGPVGDRVLCLVDPSRDRVLRTVENPALVRVLASWSAGRLGVSLGDRQVAGVPEPTGDVRKADYWGRVAEVELLAGPWAALLSEHVGHPVALARPVHPGDVVYGGSVSLVTTSSLHRLSARLGRPVESARFRPTFVVDTDGEPAGVERHWAGREVTVGGAVVRVRGPVPRCAVIDLDPVSGRKDVPVLRTLAGYGRGEGAVPPAREPEFGVDADVVRPGMVACGAPVAVGRTE